jgi:hypothetical protein
LLADLREDEIDFQEQFSNGCGKVLYKELQLSDGNGLKQFSFKVLISSVIKLRDLIVDSLKDSLLFGFNGDFDVFNRKKFIILCLIVLFAWLLRFIFQFSTLIDYCFTQLHSLFKDILNPIPKVTY